MRSPHILCVMCGNTRSFTLKECPFCGEKKFYANTESSSNAFTVNLEEGLPTIDEAFERFETYLEKLQNTGVRMIKVIHGQGSLGPGKIKKAFRDALDYGKWSDSIAEVYYGESLKSGQKGLEEFKKSHPSLIRGITLDMLGNSGVTLLILYKDF